MNEKENDSRKLNKSLNVCNIIASKVSEMGGRAYFVGGYVRDKLMYKYHSNSSNSYDIDIEIHGITNEELETILSSIANYKFMGKSFGVYSLYGYDIDIALPRREIKSGDKHIDFEIEIDPFIGTFEASRRRDFTINSILQDILSGEFIDNFNGISDINNRVIRHVDEKKFQEDALRVLRACQFASRFNFNISDDTLKLCESISLSNLSKERVFEETRKALLLSQKPSIYFNYLLKMNQTQWYNELFDLIEVDQNAIYHAEGNVFIHTMMVLDEGAKLLDLVEEKLFFMCSLLCHDLGKAKATVFENGKIKSIGHEVIGVEIATYFLKRLTNNKKLIYYVKNMVLLHMKPNMYAAHNSKIKTTNKMFYESVNPNDLIMLAIADGKGRISSLEETDNYTFLTERFEIYKEYMSRDYIDGNDLIENGIIPDDTFSKLINYITNLRLSGVEKKAQLSQVLAYKKSLKKDENTK